MNDTQDGFDPARECELRLSWREDGGLRIWSPTHAGLVLSHSRADLVMRDVLPALAEMGFRADIAPTQS